MDALTIARILEPLFEELVPPRLARDCAAHAAMSLDSSARSVEEDGAAIPILRHALQRARLPHVWQSLGTGSAPTFSDQAVDNLARRAYAALTAAGYDDVSGPSVRQSGKRPRRT